LPVPARWNVGWKADRVEGVGQGVFGAGDRCRGRIQIRLQVVASSAHWWAWICMDGARIRRAALDGLSRGRLDCDVYFVVDFEGPALVCSGVYQQVRAFGERRVSREVVGC